jgi:predicted TIM-barrel fold metal-dependent hydrolase
MVAILSRWGWHHLLATRSDPMTLPRLISSDSHVNVQHDQVKERLDPRFHDAYDGALQQAYTEMLGGNAAKANMSGLKHVHASHGRPGYADPAERLADMDIDGVDVEVLYCEVSAYRYLYLMREGSREATRAFNDTLLAFGSVDPTRLVVTAQVPIHDVDFAVEEVQRVASLGGKSLQLPVFPNELGQPDYFDERYDRLFSVIAETGLPICNHIGLNTALNQLADRDPVPRLAWTMSCMPPSACEALGMWLLTGPLVKHPELKVVFVEPGLGWVAYYLHFLDDMVLRQGYEFPLLQGELPSFYYHRNMAMTFIDEPDPIRFLRHRLGTENLMWSSDYPHPVSTWPKSRLVIDELFEGIPDAERDAMVSGNAARIWGL